VAKVKNCRKILFIMKVENKINILKSMAKVKNYQKKSVSSSSKRMCGKKKDEQTKNKNPGRK